MEYPPGWTCELVVVKLELYLVGSLSWAESLAVAEHLEACSDCPHRLVQLKGGSGDAFAVPRDPSPGTGGRRG